MAKDELWFTQDKLRITLKKLDAAYEKNREYRYIIQCLSSNPAYKKIIRYLREKYNERKSMDEEVMQTDG